MVRLSAPGLLQILTNDIKDIQIVDNFKPAGAPESKNEGPAVKIAAGISLQELYTAAARRTEQLLGKQLIQLGLQEDTASKHFTLTIQLKKELVIANEYQNNELFWALRGGGSGTFGVIFWEAVTAFHTEIPALNDAGGAGYYWMIPNAPLSENVSVSTMYIMLVFPNQTDTT
ncbi:uncharacterized protein BDW43DRAFT_309420 [Aspergillus alliaceus]|uniref:uncharacterized protein n=1 Tax=Petromyces alliaceus TaxID=209559 RepID=UPI0012A59756|nr:uncharacterized protein BDW43DRAFT_309420 [Aspergillus alliaceus]KAB8235563.1 hypothetical protein BDW43DRAFT_309420 [Aspergillus alliaceus]